MAHDEEHSRLRKSLLSAFNAQGHGLQHAIVNEAGRAFREDHAEWSFEAIELPVQVRGKDSRIDVVLKNIQCSTYLCIECKRVNPKFSRWLFLHAPLTLRSSSSDSLLMDGIQHQPGTTHPFRSIGFRGTPLGDERAFDIGIVCKNRERDSNETGRGRSAIEEAVSQACIGSNGLLEHWFSRRGIAMNVPPRAYVVPVIVTSAELFSSPVDLSLVNLATGDLASEEFEFKHEKWLYYQYPVSMGIRPDNFVVQPTRSVSSLVLSDFLRTVPVVNSTHFGEFLRSFRTEWIGPFEEIQRPDD